MIVVLICGQLVLTQSPKRCSEGIIFETMSPAQLLKFSRTMLI